MGGQRHVWRDRVGDAERDRPGQRTAARPARRSSTASSWPRRQARPGELVPVPGCLGWPGGFSFRLAVVPPARLALRVWPAVNECVIHHRHLPEYGRQFAVRCHTGPGARPGPGVWWPGAGAGHGWPGRLLVPSGGGAARPASPEGVARGERMRNPSSASAGVRPGSSPCCPRGPGGPRACG